MMDNAANLDLRWIRGKTGNWQRTIDEVELIAAEILQKYQDDSSIEWSLDFIKRTGQEPHAGDCSLCRSWLTAPISCEACTYDVFMLKAWEQKRQAVEAALTVKTGNKS
jgi:hypothetical protein